MLMLSSIILALVFVVSANSFWTMWLGLEMFNFFFTPWLMEEESYKKSSKIFFYFIIQVMASGGLLLGMSLPNLFFFYVILIISMLIKLASFPFHYWVLMIIEGMSWTKFSFFLTISKLGPIMVLNLANPQLSMIKSVWGGLLIPLLGLKTSSLRVMLTYSSIAYMSWIITAICLSKGLLFFFISSYWSIFIITCILFNNSLIKSVKDLFQSSFSYLEICCILCLMGFPPFLGFFPKLFTLKTMCTMNLIPESFFLSILSVIPFYFYLKMLMFMFMKFSYLNNSFLPIKKSNNSLYLKVFLFTSSLEVLLFSCF